MYGRELVNAFWSEDNDWSATEIHPIRDAATDVFRTAQIALLTMHERMTRILESHQNPAFVDLGGGLSTHVYLPQYFLKYTTVLDGCDAFLAKSRCRSILGCDLNEGIPLPDESVDAAISLFTIRYLFKELFITEVLRILKPGAPFFILDYEQLGHPLEESPFRPDQLINDLPNRPSSFTIRQFHPMTLKPELRNVWEFEGVK